MSMVEISGGDKGSRAALSNCLDGKSSRREAARVASESEVG